MKKTASILFGLALVCAFAAMTTGCRSPNKGFSPGSITATLSNSNHVGNAIAAGNQISSMMDADSVIGSFRDVAMQASKSGTEMSLTAVGHGASKQPNVQRESKATEKLTNSLSSAIRAAKSGGSDPAALAKFGADLIGGLAELSEEAANPPASDDASLIGFDLKIGPGANIAGVAVSGEMARTRIETVKASRSTYSRTASSDTTESNTPAGIKAIAEAMIAVRPPTSPAAVVGGPQTGAQPEDAAPEPAVSPGDSGTGEPSTARAYVAKNYPGLRLGGGNVEKNGSDRTPDESNLWKPVRENGGNLCVIIAHSKYGAVKRVTVDGEVLDFDAIGNGWRLHLNADKAGTAYSGNVQVLTDTGTWTGKVTSVGKKQTFALSKTVAASDLEPAVTPPAPKPEVVAAPGESLAP